MNPPHSSKSAGAFLRILAWPSALALGALAAFLYSLKQVNPEVRIVIDAWSWIIFGLGSAAAWFVMRKVFRLAEAAD
ncbi:MAG TPA: hypothetical protein VLD18_03255, partial [Verrucomicrobiae bacterium]|nr:hypothetical protein [Verrucomicrobiae bacterium]